MTHRLLAVVLLAPLALAACDHDNPIGPVDTRLVGRWADEPQEFQAIAPNGSTDLRLRQEWIFRSDGTFHYTHQLIDAATQRVWVMSALDGTWSARDDALRLVIRGEFDIDPSHAVDSPPYSPVDPFVRVADYLIENDILRILSACPPDASCIGAWALHRVATGPEVPFAGSRRGP